MNFAVWAIFGITAGIITHYLDPFAAKGGLIGSITFGFVGAMIGGFIATAAFGSANGFDLLLFIIAGAAALMLLLLQRTMFLRS